LAKTGGTSPFDWTLTAGSLPPGLNLNASTGVISGTPTTVGVSNFTVTVTDGALASDPQALSIHIVNPPTLTSLITASRGQGATAQSIVLTGTNFQNLATVSFSGTGVTAQAPGTMSVSGTKLTILVDVASGAATGARNVTVTNPDGGTVTLNNAFTVN